MPVLLTRRAPRSPKLSRSAVVALGETMLLELELADSELSVLLTDDPGIQLINRQHRGKDRPTDVLSFPQVHFKKPMVPLRGEGLAILGDVIISLDTAQRQATQRRRPLIEEVRFLLAHGVLHLLGYDHMELDDKRLMTAMTKRLVAACQSRTQAD